MRGALWLDQHAGNDEVIATNVHCVPIGRPRPCDARAFWVAGLAGRRTLVESWGYTDQTVAANGIDGLKYPLQPAPYPGVLAINQHVFEAGDKADLQRLRDYGVRWLLADTRAGEVSPRLAEIAKVVYISGPVTVYRLG
jgi:hypothetical protein